MAVETEELKWLLNAEDKASPVLTNLLKKLQEVENAVDSLNNKLNNIGGGNSSAQKTATNNSRNKLDLDNQSAKAQEKTTKELEKQVALYKKITKYKADLTTEVTTVSRSISAGKRIDRTEVEGELKKVTETALPPKGVLASSLVGDIKNVSKDLATNLTKIVTEEITKDKKYARTYLQDEQGNFFQTKETVTDITTPLPPEKQKKNILDYAKQLKSALKINNKFLKSFGRIALYRAIRTVLSSIVNLFKDGFSNIATTSDTARNSLIELKTFSTSLSVSLSSMLLPVVQSLTTLLEPLSYALIENANAMAREQAISSGLSTYYKINAEAVKDYAKQLNGLNGQLTQLDKFATLSQGNPVLGAEVSVDNLSNAEDYLSETNNQAKSFADTITNIIELIKNLVTWLTNLPTGGFRNILSAVSLLLGPIGLIVSIISSLSTLLDKDASPSAKVFASILIGVASAMTVLAIATNFLGGITKGVAAAAAVVGAIGIGASAVLGTVSSFATGGFPDMGSVFIANEAGPEFIGTIGSRTAVANNDQIVEAVSQGVYGAVSRAFSENRSSGSGDVYLDGKKVGTVVANGVYTEGVKAGYWNK